MVTEHARARVVDLQSVRIGEFLDKQVQPEHAGEAETSVMLYLYPDMVRVEDIEDYPLDPKQLRRYLRGRMPRPPDGCKGTIGHPSAATAEKGEKIYKYVLEKIRTKIFDEPED